MASSTSKITVEEALEIIGPYVRSMTDEDYNRFLQNLTKPEDFATESKRYLNYTPDLLLVAATKKFSANPEDCVQAAEKLYLSAVFILKEKMLKANIWVITPTATNAVASYLISFLSTEVQKTEAKLAWARTQKYHRFHYNEETFSKSKFFEAGKSIEKFKDLIGSIPVEPIRSRLELLKNQEEVKVRILEVKSYKREFCRKSYEVNYHCF